MARRAFAPRKSLKDQVKANAAWAAFASPDGKAPPLPESLAYLGEPKRTYTKRIDAGPTEAQVLKSVLAYLRSHSLVASVERSQSGVFQEGNRIIRVGFVGKLDISGFLRNGARYFEIEVKRPGAKPTDAQQKRIDAVLSSGGISGYVTSIEEVAALIKQQ